MKLGIFSVMDFHPDRQGSAAGFYREMLDLAVEAEQLGYDSAWVAEIFQQLASFGVERVLCLMNFGGMPFRLVLDSLTLTAQEVMPRLASCMSDEV